jgi:hypothetical protein
VNILPDFILDELEAVDSPDTEPHSKKDAFLVEKAFNGRRASGLEDGKAWYEEGNDPSILPQNEAEITKLIGSDDYEPALDRFPGGVRLWLLRRWTKGKILHDERESYLASFCHGVIAAKDKAEKETARAAEATKRAAQKVRLVKTHLTNTKTFIGGGGKKGQVSQVNRIHETDRELWEASLKERLDAVLEEHIKAAKLVWEKEQVNE